MVVVVVVRWLAEAESEVQEEKVFLSGLKHLLEIVGLQAMTG